MLLDGELRLEGGGRFHFGLCFERGVDDDLQIKRERFFADEIKRSKPHRLDDCLGRAECARYNDNRVRVALPHLDEQFHPAERREMRFRDEEIRVFTTKSFVSLFRVGRGNDARRRRLQLVLHPLEEIRFRIDNENDLRLFHGAGQFRIFRIVGFQKSPTALNSSEAAFPFMICGYRISQVVLAEVGPEFLGHVNLGVAELPEEKV